MLTGNRLNIRNLVPDGVECETGERPWGDLIYDDGCALSTYAALAALKELADAWEDDHGQNREFVMSTLSLTIDMLLRWKEAFAAAVLTQDVMDDATHSLETMMAERRVTGADLAALARVMDTAALARKASGFKDEHIRALVTAAFAEEEE